MAGEIEVKTSSCKAKGRKLQQEIRDDLRTLTKDYQLVDDDWVSTGMGQAGLDIIQSPAARRLLPLAIEAKNVEKLNVVGVFQKHAALYKDHPGLKLLIHKRNRTSTMVTLAWADLLKLLEGKLLFQTHQNNN